MIRVYTSETLLSLSACYGRYGTKSISHVFLDFTTCTCVWLHLIDHASQIRFSLRFLFLLNKNICHRAPQLHRTADQKGYFMCNTNEWFVLLKSLISHTELTSLRSEVGSQNINKTLKRVNRFWCLQITQRKEQCVQEIKAAVHPEMSRGAFICCCLKMSPRIPKLNEMLVYTPSSLTRHLKQTKCHVCMDNSAGEILPKMKRIAT